MSDIIIFLRRKRGGHIKHDACRTHSSHAIVKRFNMGNGNSIQVVIPAVARSASILKGVVAVVITKPQPASKLCIRLHCDEYVKIPFGDSSASIREMKGKTPAQELAVFESTSLEAGQYKFPFELKLPNLPTSFSYDGGEKLKGSVSSYITAFFVNSNGSELCLVKEPIFVIPAVTDVRQYHFNLTFQATSGACCWKRTKDGNVNVRVAVDKPSYKPGDTVGVRIQFQNTTDVVVKSLEVGLARMIELSDGTLTFTIPNSMASKKLRSDFDGQLVELQIPRTEVGPHCYGKYARKYFAVRVASSQWSLTIEVILPIHIEPSLRTPQDKRPTIPPIWNPTEAGLKHLTVPEFESYTEMHPTPSRFPGLLKV